MIDVHGIEDGPGIYIAQLPKREHEWNDSKYVIFVAGKAPFLQVTGVARYPSLEGVKFSQHNGDVFINQRAGSRVVDGIDYRFLGCYHRVRLQVIACYPKDAKIT